MMIEHYYHIYADGVWKEAVEEHLEALNHIDSKMVNMHVLAVGSHENTSDALNLVINNLPDSVASHQTRCMKEGWEHPTIEWMAGNVRRPGYINTPILYCHTKGAANPSIIADMWRQSMTQHLIYRWEECLDRLNEVDAVGCHWLTKKQFPTLIEVPIFGGNFWWANSDFVKKLEPVNYDTRWDAEAWLGRGNPTTYDLNPGWPNPQSYQDGRKLLPCV